MGTPVPGPGQFSKRTDKAVGEANRSLSNADYGEQAAYQDQRSGAPMAQAPSAPMDIGSLMGSMSPNTVGLNEPSMMDDVPVTDGAALGPGAGTEVLSQPDDSAANAQTRAWIVPLEWLANQPGTSDANRNLIRALKAQM